MLMGLRLAEGVDLAALSARFGMAPADLASPDRIALYQRQGLVAVAGERITVTEPGMLVLNSLIAELVPAGLVA
jgi:oxygen-independent coproporphyrinogen-3 oxidase